jgi:agmatinase
VILPVPFEATTSYGGGASRAPAAVLEASRQVDLYDRETGRPYEDGIAMLPLPRDVVKWNREAKPLAARVIAAQGSARERSAPVVRALARVNALGDRVNAWTRRETGRLLDGGRIVFVLGGDHSVPFGAIEAFADRHPGLGILHLDAHCDLRDAYEGFTWSHASIFHNVATRLPKVARIVQVGVRDMGSREADLIRRSRGRIVLFHDDDLGSRAARGASWETTVRDIVSRLPKRVYLSFDIDGLDPTLCPNTGTPVPGGLSFRQLTGLLAGLVASGRTIVGGDLCEVSPGRGSEWDANVGARILYKMIGYTLLSRNRGRGKARGRVGGETLGRRLS